MNIIESLAREGLEKPIFGQGGGSFRVVFKRSGGVSGGVNILLNYIKKNPGKRVVHFERDLGVAKRTIERWLTKLKAEGKIEFRGSPKTGGYYSK